MTDTKTIGEYKIVGIDNEPIVEPKPEPSPKKRKKKKAKKKKPKKKKPKKKKPKKKSKGILREWLSHLVLGRLSPVIWGIQFPFFGYPNPNLYPKKIPIPLPLTPLVNGTALKPIHEWTMDKTNEAFPWDQVCSALTRQVSRNEVMCMHHLQIATTQNAYRLCAIGLAPQFGEGGACMLNPKIIGRSTSPNEETLQETGTVMVQWGFGDGEDSMVAVFSGDLSDNMERSIKEFV